MYKTTLFLSYSLLNPGVEIHKTFQTFNLLIQLHKRKKLEMQTNT